ncbi:MAG: radical SAM protein [Chitinophagales bacterium]
MSLQLPYDNTAGPFSGDKILWHLEALEALKNGKVPAPISVELDLTNVCNLDCPYCTNASYRKTCEEFLAPETAEKVIRELSAMGVKSITFTGGGEPTMYLQLEKMLRLAKSLGLDVALITNGLRTFSAEAILETCTWVRFSVDAFDRESYLQSKKVDGFTKVCRNITALTEAKKQSNSNCTIGIGILSESIGSGMFAKTTEILKPLGADYIQFRPMTFLNSDKRSEAHVLQWSEADYKNAKAMETDSFKVFISAAKYQNRNGNLTERKYTHCTGVYFACVIGATGDVWICCHMRGNKKFSLGNIHERSFTEIWNDTETRNAIYARIGNFEECMPLCRFHGQNTLLANINWQPQHQNFL